MLRNFQPFGLLFGGLGCLLLAAACLRAETSASGDLSELTPGRTAAQNALWTENPLNKRFNSTNRVVVADLKGPAVITMIHFALPAVRKLNRDLALRMFWDGEQWPSVNCPLVDFFCDPAGVRETVNTAWVNRCRGFNAYFPMPFRKSARLELDYGGPVPPGKKLWGMMPCYSYVLYRTLKRVPADAGYFHAAWRQEALLLGQRDYVALEARGRGKFVGWNVTVRLPGRAGYPVDENEKFYIDGEKTASVEFQGLEDSFGFSWGFPPAENQFPLTGYFPFFKGAAAYRFFAQDAISFHRSLRVAIGFGVNESPVFRQEFSKPGNTLQFSSTVYWYQREPHAPLPPLPPASDRAPAPEQRFWPAKEAIPSAEQLRRRGVKLEMWCGRRDPEIVFAARGYGASVTRGSPWDGWSLPVYCCRADPEAVSVTLAVPPRARGTVRVYVIDPDDFEGGRSETVAVAGRSLGKIQHFHAGRWLEQPVTAEQTAGGQVVVGATNARHGSNAVISIIEWISPHA